MKNGFVFFIFIFYSGLLYPQLYTGAYKVTGVVRDYTGEPLIGVSVAIQGTTTGTITGIDGDYSINAKPGSTLVFSYIGFNQTVEPVRYRKRIDVTMKEDGYGGYYVYENYSNPYIKEHIPAVKQPDMSLFLEGSEKNEKAGIGILTDDTSVIGSIYGNISEIKSINKNENDSLYSVSYFDEKDYKSGYDISYTGSVGVDRVMKLPELQNTYSQGYDHQWFGPDKTTIFSWGADMENLEFDGSDYNYDKNGRLVQKGTGTGISSRVYKPGSFFKTGFQTAHNLSLKMPAVLKGYYEAAVSQNHRESVIRRSYSDASSVSLGMKGLKFDRFSLDIFGSYKYSEGKLLMHGANQASVLGALYSTPVSFDNTNGFKAQKAVKESSAWLLPDGTPRTYAPGLADNPYKLIKSNRDKDKLHETVGGFNLRFDNYGFRYGISAGINQQKDKRSIGVYEGERGYMTDFLYNRRQEHLSVNTNSFLVKQLDRLELNAGFNYKFTREMLDVKSYTGLSVLEEDRYKKIRNEYELRYGLVYFYRTLRTTLKLNNTLYFSNTVDNYINFFPYVGFDMNIGQLLGLTSWRSPGISITASLSKHLREAPLVSGEEIAFTNLPVSRYREYIPTGELIFQSSLKPETYLNKVAGLSFTFRNVYLSAEFFRTDITDFISNKNALLENTGDVKNTGWKFSGNYKLRIKYDWNLNLEVKWYRDKPVVKKTYMNNSYIPLAGFTDVHTGMAAGKPMGAIFGSDFRRNEKGQVIIGENGFPIKDVNPVMIGNPNPDWKMSFTPKISWRQFNLLLNFDIKKGGDMWNGTQAYSDYLGRSEKTAEMRNIKGYIFDGITENGQMNSVLVDFYSGDVMNNRWTRYGFSGVASEHIEDASWIRLSELRLGYKLNLDSKRIKDITLGFSIYNVFLLTNYNGTDPASSLFNYKSAVGLDLFNSPGVRTILFTVKMRISDVL